MEQTIEAIGTDVEHAISDGLARLGVGRDDIEIEVLDDGSRGLFGIGAREARVRLTLRERREGGKARVFAATPVEPVAPPPSPPAAGAPAQPLSAEPEAVRSPPEGEVRDEAEIAREVLLELLDLLGIEQAQVTVRQAKPASEEEESPLALDVQGADLEVLIGRRGETLAALQHITRLIVGREMEGWVHLVVDVDGFKARREKSLRRLAQRMAEQAVKTDRVVALEPMPPHERRIIHVALRDHPHVSTESVGERDRRKVTIIPR